MTSFGYRLNPLYAIKECLSCGALYTGDFCCSKGNVKDKILVPKPPKNCARYEKCGHPVNGPYCQGCAFLREKLEEDLVSYFQNFQNTSESSDDSTNIVNAPREPFVVKKDHGVNPSQIDKCCCECGNALDGIFCQQCICKSCGKGAHTGYNWPPKVLIISNPEPCNQTMNNELPKTLQSFDSIAIPTKKIQYLAFQNLTLLMNLPTFSTHLHNLLYILVNFARAMLNMITTVHLKLRLSIRSRVTVKTLISRKIFTIFNNSIAVVISVGAHTRLLNVNNMGDEHLDTIPATESDELIKSCVETLVPNPSEAEDENGCDLLLVLQLSRIFSSTVMTNPTLVTITDEDFPEEIYSNPLFEEEIISIKIDKHHFNVESDLIESLLNHVSSIISSSSKIDSLLDEFAGELTLLKSIPLGIDKTDCHPKNEIRFAERLLYDNSSPRTPEEFVYENSDADIQSFSPSPIPVKDSDFYMEEIDLLLTPDDLVPPGIEDDDDNSKRDILIHEELLDNYSLSLPVNESFYFDIPSFSRPPAKPPGEFETFSDHTKETSNGSTNTHANYSRPKYDSFIFEIEPDQGEFTSIVMKDYLGEPRVHVPNVLPTHPITT
nr:hypothetical protein [Tanacetum cinerariifolium]